MPRPTDPSKYPAEFAEAIRIALRDGELRLPYPAPRSARGYIQSYLKALEKAGQVTEEMKDLMVRVEPGLVILCRRSQSPLARSIAIALRQQGEATPVQTAEQAQADLSRRLAGDAATPQASSQPAAGETPNATLHPF